MARRDAGAGSQETVHPGARSYGGLPPSREIQTSLGRTHWDGGNPWRIFFQILCGDDIRVFLLVLNDLIRGFLLVLNVTCNHEYGIWVVRMRIFFLLHGNSRWQKLDQGSELIWDGALSGLCHFFVDRLRDTCFDVAVCSPQIHLNDAGYSDLSSRVCFVFFPQEFVKLICFTITLSRLS